MSDDELDGDRVAPFLPAVLGHTYVFERECPSTQDVLKGRELLHGAVAVAEHQTHGRGRSGRRWEDVPSRSILVSVLLQPPRARAHAELSLVAALATAETVEEVTGGATHVKWPNDVLLEGGKVAGLLLEGDGDDVVVGIGLNVNQSVDDLPQGARPPAASLSTVTGRQYDRAPLLGRLLDRLELRYADWCAEGIAPIATGVDSRNWLRGRTVEAQGRTGIAGGIGPDGRLEILHDDGSVVLVGSGEVVALSLEPE